MLCARGRSLQPAQIISFSVKSCGHSFQAYSNFLSYGVCTPFASKECTCLKLSIFIIHGNWMDVDF